mmetsp:Transcript_3402/g.8632  ORF Transcript_3402/g.8632 Transcript_3402/m.8632 type:complete len:629 (+) Transcript_3402:121-2007(+)
MTVEASPARAASCTLTYPDRFHAAVQFISKPPPGAKAISDETRLLLYALNQQATAGPCKEAKPWGWNVVETAKWQTWSQLGSMSSVEAMRLYVRELEEEQPDWWSKMDGYTPPPPEPVAPASAATEGLGALSAAVGWQAPEISGAKKPPPRYEHAIASIENKMFLIGGNYGGRYLSDVWTLDLEKLEWQPTVYSGGKQAPGPPPSSGPQEPPPPQPSLPPCAGHAVVPWGTSLLVVGGHAKGKDKVAEMQVRVLETHAMAWSMLTPSGPTPPSLGGHTATLIGSSLYVFGGEDSARRPVNTLYVLDLESMTWSEPETVGTAPAARSAHVATSYGGRYLVVFGGGSVAHCFKDLQVLDTEDMEWFSPPTEGVSPSARAGHAAAVLGDHWFITGGGNNTSGCGDMLALDMSNLGISALAWSRVCEVGDKRSPICSEGLSLQAVPSHGALVAFGGYNGKYHNAVHVHKTDVVAVVPQSTPKHPMSKTPSKREAAPEESGEAAAATAPATADAGKQQEDLVAKLEAAVKEAEDMAREANTSRESAAHELALMRRQLVSAQNGLAEAEKSLEEAKGALGGEQQKVFKLEVEVAELRQRLGHMEELEKEVEMLRRQAAEASKKGTGLWGYIAGT